MKLVVLNGTMGVGKLTTAKKLADVTEYPILHNYLIRDVLVNFFEQNSDAYTKLTWQMRLGIVEEMISEGRSGLIWTALLSKSPRIRKLYDELEEMLHKVGGEVFYVNLTCELEEQKRRVVSDDRKEHKKILTTEEFEQRMKSVDIFNATPSDRTIEIDNTHLTPDEVAKKIVTTFNLDKINKELSNENQFPDEANENPIFPR